jgi:hypothetical protein
MASGHVSRIKRPNTWLHRPMLQNVKKALANTEPSTHGTFETSSDVRSMVATGGKADICQTLIASALAPRPKGSVQYAGDLLRGKTFSPL